METVLVLAAPCLALAACYCGWRAAHLFLAWIPAVANVVRSDYSDLEQQDDFWHFGMVLGTMRGWNWRDGKGARLIHDDIRFVDRAGGEHRASVARRVRRGWRPYSVYTVWYDPADPAQVTAFGPGYWLMLALLFLCMLATVFEAGLRIAGRA